MRALLVHNPSAGSGRPTGEELLAALDRAGFSATYCSTKNGDLEDALAQPADIVIIGMSIWFGVRNSVSQMVIERLDGTYNERNAAGQYPLYNKVGCVVVTGNEVSP